MASTDWPTCFQKVSSTRIDIYIHESWSWEPRSDKKHSAEAHQPSALSMASSSSSNLRGYYHVFLSFRGTDVRNNFLSHLYAALDQKGLHTFMDSEELRIGEQISPALMKAIEGSRVAIIVFSKNYASSPWCLEELARIMECKEQRDLKVFPLFYKVEPREVRTPRESYREAMAKHESKLGKDSEKVKRWEKALFDAGSLSGWNFHEGDEAEFIQRIVKELSIHLERTPLHIAKYPVGMDSRVQELISLSQKESGNDDFLMIGLWGTGGIGKTTLAKAMYNAIESQFQGTCFLARVRETANGNDGLVALQAQLLSQIFPHSKFKVHDVDRAITLIRERLCRKKVLLVLDDVDQLDQLNALAGEGHWFGRGSRIIVTSRDKHLLTSHGINCVYEVKTLNSNEARDLFCRHAFPNSKKVEIRRDLIARAVHYAKRLPLALQVFGSFLCGRKEPAWESALRNLSKSPDQTVNRVLKTSFDGLDDKPREIFLDIACFFKGKRIEYIKQVLDSCGFESTIGMEVLIDRSLITNEHGTLQMHDLIQLMGKDIVNQECPDDPRKRSRLWIFEDVLDILCEDTETNAVKAIVLDSPQAEEITISPHAFANMKRLRMLILSEVHISSEGHMRLPNELRWLEWPNVPDLEFGSGRKELVGIDVHGSRVKQLGSHFTNFKKLKFINFSKCESLISFPALSSVPNLESLDLSDCKSLVEVHQSVGYLEKLRSLLLRSCSNLTIFPNELKTKSLRSLDLADCSKLEKFPDIPEKMEHLSLLFLQNTAIKELPMSIENLVSVERMMLQYCKNLATLPPSIYKLHNLVDLDLQGCSNLVMFPKNLEDSIDHGGYLGFQNLFWLNLSSCNLSEVEFLERASSFPKLLSLCLSGNKFTHLPTCINKYDDLEELDVEKCQQLQGIPQLPSNIVTLRASGCKSLQKLPDMSSCLELFRKRVKMADLLSPEGAPYMRRVKMLLTGGEMPEWFLDCEDDYISFWVPQDLYGKILGLAVCVVLGPEEGKVVDAACDISVNVNHYSAGRELSGPYSLESDHVWLQYFPCRRMYGFEEFLINDWSEFFVSLQPWNGRLKKCGFRLICEQQDDDLKVVLQDHQPTEEKNWISEERGSEEDNGETMGSTKKRRLSSTTAIDLNLHPLNL